VQSVVPLQSREVGRHWGTKRHKEREKVLIYASRASYVSSPVRPLANGSGRKMPQPRSRRRRREIVIRRKPRSRKTGRISVVAA
jgi:hypothetical protein